ncbi:homeodomain-like protein [Tanacetum coccineum]
MLLLFDIGSYGYVGNKSAVFPPQLLGYDVDPIMSVKFSNLTGYPTFKGQVLNGKQLWELIKGLEGAKRNNRATEEKSGKDSGKSNIQAWMDEFPYERLQKVLISTISQRSHEHSNCNPVFERHIGTGQMLALLRSDTAAAQYLLQAINKRYGPDQDLCPGENQSRLPGISRLKRDYAAFAGYGGKVSTHGKEDKKVADLKYGRWSGKTQELDMKKDEDAKSEEIREIDIENLTMEQYLALNHGDTRRGVRKPEIEGNVYFEIKGQFLRELTDNTFSRNEDKDAYEHVGMILEIASLFNTQGVSRDPVMLRVFPLTLIGRVKSVKITDYRKDSFEMTPGNNSPSRNSSKLEEMIVKYLEEPCKRQGMFDEWMERFRENTEKNLRRHDSAIKGLEENVSRLLKHKNSTGHEFVKKIVEENGLPLEAPTKEPGTSAEKINAILHQMFIRTGIKIEEMSMVKLNARCSAVLLNKLPPKEKDLGSFIFPCVIGNTTVSNALAELGANISVMPFSMFKRLGLGTPKPISMVIEMANRSMQSHKGIVENDLVKIDKFIFSVDFMILDIISLEVGKEKVAFNANEGRTPLSVCVINNFQGILQQGYELGACLRRKQFQGMAKNLHVFVGCHNFQIDFIVLEDISEFVEKGLTEVPLGKPFKDCVGLEVDVTQGLLWFNIGNDKTIFNMPRTFNKFYKLTIAHHNKMTHVLRTSDEDKAKGIYHPY